MKLKIEALKLYQLCHKFKYKPYWLMQEQKNQDQILGFHSSLDAATQKLLIQKLVSPPLSPQQYS